MKIPWIENQQMGRNMGGEACLDKRIEIELDGRTYHVQVYFVAKEGARETLLEAEVHIDFDRRESQKGYKSPAIFKEFTSHLQRRLQNLNTDNTYIFSKVSLINEAIVGAFGGDPVMAQIAEFRAISLTSSQVMEYRLLIGTEGTFVSSLAPSGSSMMLMGSANITSEAGRANAILLTGMIVDVVIRMLNKLP